MPDESMDESLNVFDEPLQSCSEDPLTGFFRDGCCNTNDDDLGSHTVCVQVNQAFLEYSRFRGNDLMTPVPEFGFPGLREGDRWCLCAARWLEACEAGMAPRVYLSCTHKRALEIVPLEKLKAFAVDVN
ncbi:MAG: DUF2237 domain-containing protein [Pseudomonadales bacterium]|nr:DUF2237 domain-containing protein [Pseudomonadales bacterium]